MASVIGQLKIQCGHPHHFFAHPLCNRQSLAKRVAQVAFHIFTLGIPLLIYHLTHRTVAMKKAEPLPDLAAASDSYELQASIEKPLTRQQLDRQKKWSEVVDHFIAHPALISFQFQRILPEIHLLDRDYALPLTEAQKQGLLNLPQQFSVDDRPILEWVVKEVLAIVELPVPASKEEQWKHSIQMIKRIHYHFEDYWKSKQQLNLKYSKLRVALEVSYLNHQSELIFNWQRKYKSNYPEPQYPKAAVRIEMDASSVSVEHQDYETLPQVLIWDPQSNQFAVHFNYYLEGKGPQSTDIELDELQKITHYAGCIEMISEEQDPEEVQKAKEAKLPLIAEVPNPTFGDFVFPSSGLNGRVKVQMIEQLEAQGLNP